MQNIEKVEIREMTFEMLFKARELCRTSSHNLTAILLGGKDAGFVDDLAKWADRVIAFEDDQLEIFNADLYKEILDRFIREHTPFLTLMGHTSWGMDLAPALAIRTGFPLATDCVDIQTEDGRPMVTPADLQREALFQGFIQGIPRLFDHRKARCLSTSR